MTDALYRKLPKVDRLLADPRLAAIPRGIAVGAVRDVLAELRAAIRDQRVTEVPDVVERVLARAALLQHGRLRPVINATGVVVHTNLGRSPWADEAIEAAVGAARYVNLQMELESGERGGRMKGVTALARHLTGAEAALVVNNCAAAVLLALTALAADREVVVSRGELVEIGGSFRIPDVVASGGARLREVGTTNRTRAADYAAAIGDQTAVLLRVHPSNFRVVGFTSGPTRTELVALAQQNGLAVVEDLGSGSLDGRHGEPSIRQAVADGVDLALFSGDKLLGGPQAGIAVGTAEAIGRMRAHPLYRALRVDKVILAALERTLALHAADGRPPTLEMLDGPLDAIEARAERLQAACQAAGVQAELDRDVGRVGGGALPDQDLDTWVVRIACQYPDQVARHLRVGEPPIVARVSNEALVLDARTLGDSVLDAVARQVAHAVELTV